MDAAMRIPNPGDQAKAPGLMAKNRPLEFAPPGSDELLEKTVRTMGCPSPEAAGPAVVRAVGDLYETMCSWLEPASLFSWTQLDSIEKGAILAGDVRVPSAKWARLASICEDATGLVAFAVTIGTRIEAGIKELSETSLVSSYVADAMASVLAEHFADAAEDHAAASLADAGLHGTSRFSPGYCDLPLEAGQKALTTLLDPLPAGLRVMPSGLMRPRKSVTAFLVAARHVPHKTPCFLCARDCPHRREPR
ncbi:MAG: hypothetical protein KKA60_09775 [Proteobacteria bacterium]|nr:hypothetical protein [Pseudomonadota bacterium]